MRLLDYTFEKPVEKYVEQLRRQYNIPDVGYLFDVLALLHLKGKGVPTAQDVLKLIDEESKRCKISKPVLSAVYKKRRHTLATLTKSPMFYALATLPDTTTALSRLLAILNRAFESVQKAQCATCQLLSDCPLGLKYVNNTSDIKLVVDYKVKAHKECPERPNEDVTEDMQKALEAINELFKNAADGKLANAFDTNGKPMGTDIGERDKKNAEKALKAAQEEMEQLSGNEAGKTGWCDFKFDHALPVFANEKLITTAAGSAKLLFELSQKFELALESAQSKLFQKTPLLAENQEHNVIESAADMTKLLPNQHALPEDIYDKKLANKSLIKQQKLEQKPHKQLLYFLLDASGSMRSPMKRGGAYAFTPATISQAFILALARKMKKQGDVVYFRWFDYGQSALKSAQNPLEYDAFESDVFACNYNGGGTNIEGAVMTALNDISAASELQLQRAEILLITDCADNVNAKGLIQAKNKIALHTLDIGDDKDEHRQLKEASDTYFKLDADSFDVTKTVNSVFTA